MINFYIIFFCMVAGILVKRYKVLSDKPHQPINIWLLNFALPAIALKYIPKIEWNTSLLFPILMPIIVWFGAHLFIYLLFRKSTIDHKTKTGLIIISGLGNTSFLGFPLTEAYYNTTGLETAILCDQACFIMTATLGVIYAAKASGKGQTANIDIIKKVFKFPPFLCTLAALVLSPFVNFSILDPFLDKIAATLVPLALFSVGLQLNISAWKADFKLISISLLYKLILAPMVILAIYYMLNTTSLTAKVTVFEAAMGPMVTAAIITQDYELNPKLTGMILGLGIPVSLITTYFWWLII